MQCFVSVEESCCRSHGCHAACHVVVVSWSISASVCVGCKVDLDVVASLRSRNGAAIARCNWRARQHVLWLLRSQRMVQCLCQSLTRHVVCSGCKVGQVQICGALQTATKGATTGSGNTKYSNCSTLFLERCGLRWFSSTAAKRRRPLSLDNIDVDSKGTYMLFQPKHNDVEPCNSATATTTTAAPSSNIINNEDKERNTEWVVWALVEGCNKDKSKQQHTISDLDNDATLLLWKSNLSFLLRSGNWFQSMKRKTVANPARMCCQMSCGPCCARQSLVPTLALLAPIPTTPSKSRTQETQTASLLLPNAMDTATGVIRSHCHCPPVSKGQKRRAKIKNKNPFFQFDVSF